MCNTDNKSTIIVGYVFSVFNRRMNKLWQGEIDLVCSRIMAAGEDVGIIWRDTDTQVRASRAAFGLSSIVGVTNANAILLYIPDLRSAMIAPSKDASALIRNRVAKMPPEEKSAFCRLAAALGVVPVLDYFAEDPLFNLGAVDDLGMTALGWACACGRTKCVEWAIQRGIVLDHLNKYSWNYGDLANANGKIDVYTSLTAAGVPSHGRSLRSRMQEVGISAELGYRDGTGTELGQPENSDNGTELG